MEDNTQAQDSNQSSTPSGGGSGQDSQPSGGQSQAQGQVSNAPVPVQEGQIQGPKGGLAGIMDQNVDISELVSGAGQNQQQSQALFNMLPLAAHPNSNFEERYFVELLVGSISLTYPEKVKILENVASLSQYQVDELIKIFEEEKGKFAELEKKHAEQIAQFEKEHVVNAQVSIQDKQEEEEVKKQEEDEAARLRKELGL